MNESIIAAANISLLALLLFICFSWIPRLRVAQFRQSMFELRDRMFDEAASGTLSFSDKAYIALRTTMNGMIRCADTVSIGQIVLLMLAKQLAKDDVSTHLPPVLEAIKGVSDLPKRKLYHQYHREMDTLIVVLLVERSVLLHVAFKIQALKSQLMATPAKKAWARAMESEAFFEGAKCAT